MTIWHHKVAPYCGVLQGPVRIPKWYLKSAGSLLQYNTHCYLYTNKRVYRVYFTSKLFVARAVSVWDVLWQELMFFFSHISIFSSQSIGRETFQNANAAQAATGIANVFAGIYRLSARKCNWKITFKHVECSEQKKMPKARRRNIYFLPNVKCPEATIICNPRSVHITYIGSV